MSMTEAGNEFIAKALVGLASPLLTAGNAVIAVGNGDTEFDVYQEDMQGALKVRKGMYPEYPKIEGNVIYFKAVFGPSEANFDWNEWGIANAEEGGVLLNRKVEYNGTKIEGQTWIFEVALSIE